MASRTLSLAILVLVFAATASAVPARLAHVEVELISETTSLARGGPPSRVALRLRPDPGWHVYWINPGDSGLATSLRWSLPEGVEAGPIEWPRPHAHAFGELTNYGYAEEVLHLVPISVAADWPAGKPVRLEAEAKWLVCEEVCIPGKADLALELPVAASPKPDPQRAAAFATARAELPREAPPGWRARFAVADGVLSLAVEGAPRGADRVELFPEANDLVDHAAPQRVEEGADGLLRISQELSSYFVSPPAEVRGVLVLYEGRVARAFHLRALPGKVAVVPPRPHRQP